MAASTQQKVDFLLKKIGYTASKTGLAEDSSLSGTKKAPFAEAVPSPLVIASTCLWSDSTYIPATPPGALTDYVKVYLSATSGHHMTVDSTVSGNRAYIAYSTYNNTSTEILGDWIDTQFGAGYIIKVYKGDPNSGGVQLSAAGSGSNDGWFFDYSSGILNFNDTNVPSGVTDSNIYIVGYRYIGNKGPTAAGGISTFTTQYVSGVSTFADDVNLYGTAGVTSAYWDKTGDSVILNDHTKASFGTGQDLQFYHDSTNSTIKNSTGTLFVDNGGTTFRNVAGTETQLTITDNGSVAAYFDNAKKIETLSVGATVTGNLGATSVSISGISTFEGSVDINNNVDVSGFIDVDGQSELDDVNVSGVSTFGQLVSASAGANIAGTAGLNVVGVATVGGQIDGNAGADISGGETTLSSATISDLTSGRLTVAGTSGALQDSSNLTFDGTNKLAVTGGLTVSAGATFSGIVDGNAGCNFSGAESTFSSATVSDLTNNRVVLAGTSGALEDSSKITFDGTTLAIVGDATFTGNVSVAGTLTSEDKTELDVVGLVTARSGVRVTSGGLIVSSGVSTFTDAIDANGGLDVTGGSGLVASSAKVSDLTAGRVVVAGTSGELEDSASLTFTAGRLAVTGGQTVSGVATFTTDIDVDGHTELDYVNVSAAATFAGFLDANAGADVAGGFVANSAKISDLTSGRVVVAGTSGELEDASTFTFSGGTVSATAFSATNLTGTLQTAAQGNVTSVGTLTGLDVNGHTELDNIQVTGIATVANVVLTKNTTGVGATIGGLNVGVVTYYGDGSQLTGIDATALKDSGGNVKVQAVTTGAVVTGLITATQGFSGEITGVGATFTNITGTLQTAAQTNITSLGNLTGLTINGDEEFYGSAGVTSAIWDKSENLLRFNDHAKATFGTGNDLAIYHDAEQSYIKDSGTGKLNVLTSVFSVANPDDDTQLIWASGNTGVVKLYFNDAQKFETTHTGAIVTGILTATDQFSGQITGVGATFTNVTGTLQTAAQTNITSLGTLTGLVVNGDQEFYGSAGVTSAIWDKSENLLNFKDHAKATFGTSNDLNIYHDHSNSYVSETGAGSLILNTNGTNIKILSDGSETMAKFVKDGASELYFDNAKKIETSYTGAIVTGIATATDGLSINADNKKLQIGAGEDLSLFHNATNSEIINSTGTLYFESDDTWITDKEGSDKMAKFLHDGAVELYWDNSKKFETTSTGAIVTGVLTATSDINTTANIYGAQGHFTDHIYIADTIVHTGDTNTKIRFPGTDTISLETAGSEALRVDSGQRLLKGLTSARGNYGNNTSGVEYGLQVEGLNALNSTLALVRNSNDANDGGIVLGKTRATSVGGNTVVQAGDDLGTITWAGSDGTSLQFGAEILAEVVSGVGDDDLPADLIFKTNGGSTSTTERLRITSAGSVGIGEDDPDANTNLHIKDTTVSQVKIEATDNTSYGLLKFIEGDHDGTKDKYIIAYNDSHTAQADEFSFKNQIGDITFITGGTSTNEERLRITSTGAVGINSATPTANYKLDVNGDLTLGEIGGTDNTYIDQKQDGDLHIINSGRTSNGASNTPGAGGVGINRYNNISGGTSLFRDFTVYNGKDSKVLVVDGSTSRVGVGTDTPEALLQIEGTEVGLQIERNAQTLKIDGNYGNGGDQSLTASSALRIYTGGANERVRFTSDGDVLIGGHSAAIDPGAYGAHLEVHGTGLDAGINVLRYSANAFGPTIVLGKSRNASIGSNTVVQEDDELGKIHFYGTDSSDWEPGASIKGVADGEWNTSSDTTDSPGRLEFYTTPNGSDTLTERFRISADGTADFNENTVQKAVLKNYTETVKAIGDTGTSATLDLADGNVFTATLTGNCTFTFTTGTNSAPNAASFTLILANDSTPSRTITWPGSVKWPNNSAPSRTTTASKTDIWTFMTPDNGTTWYGNIALYNFT